MRCHSSCEEFSCSKTYLEFFRTKIEQSEGGLKESKELEKEFEKVQKPWAKLLKKVNDSKKTYYRYILQENYYFLFHLFTVLVEKKG